MDLTRGTSPAAHRVKIYYITQASTSPPTFILFTNQRDKLHFSYERFLENRLREEFDFTGAPIRFIQRVRERGRDTRERAIKMKERPARRQDHARTQTPPEARALTRREIALGWEEKCTETPHT